MSSLFLRRSWRPALFVAAEVLLYLSYQHHDARFHWFLHFFVGTSAALIAMAVLTYWSARPMRFPLLWLFTGHIIAMLPDILWNLQVLPHQPWMDVYLLHISAHFMPGRNWTWYVIFLVCLALYLSARRAASEEISIKNEASAHARLVIDKDAHDIFLGRYGGGGRRTYPAA